MKLFKKTICWSMLMVLAFGISFASCSSDDDEAGGSSNINACYIKVDGKHIDFKYAYYFEEVYEEDGEVYKDTEITFATTDILYYYKNPEKLKKGTIISDAYLGLNKELASGTTTDYALEINYNLDYYDVMNDEDEDGELHGENYNWYCEDWNKDMTPLTITKTGSNYVIEASSIPMLADDDNDGIDSQSRKTTAELYFNGSLMDISDIIEIEDLSYSAKVVKVDEPTMQWLKKIRKNN